MSLFDHALTPLSPPPSLALTTLNALPSSRSLYLKALLGRRRGLKRGEAIERVGVVAPLTITHAWLERYLTCCGWTHTEGALPPLTVGQVCAAPVQSALLMGDLSPLSPLGLVHASNELRALAPLPLDAPLSVTVWFGETEWRARGVRFDVHTSITSPERPGEPLWVGRTSVFKAMSPDKEALKARNKEPRAPHVSLKEQAEATGGCDALQQLHLSLPADLGRQYAPIANDHNPIHLYGWSARLFGFKSAIMHGMWSVGRALALGSPNPSDVSVGEHHVTFKRPLPLPSAPSITLLSTERGQRFEVYTEDGRLSIEGAWREG